MDAASEGLDLQPAGNSACQEPANSIVIQLCSASEPVPIYAVPETQILIPPRDTVIFSIRFGGIAALGAETRIDVRALDIESGRLFEASLGLTPTNP